MADQIFSTIQIPVNQWRWLPVTCLNPATGVGLTSVAAEFTDVSFIRSGELSVTKYNDNGYNSEGSTFVTTTPAGSTTIKLFDTSNFPPENGYLHLDPLGAGGGAEFVKYSYNNVSTGELTLDAPTVNTHTAGTPVNREDWVEVDPVVAPGSYLLLLPPTVLSKTDVFTYIVTDISGDGPETFERYFNTIDIVGSLDPVSMTTPSLATCKLYGFVVDLAGAAIANTGISVKLLSVPSVMSNAGIYDNIVSAKTDSNGYFEINVLQQATVDVVIANIGYRRTITVPGTTSAKLFELS